MSLDEVMRGKGIEWGRVESVYTMMMTMIKTTKMIVMKGETILLSSSSTCVTKSASALEDILLFDPRSHQSSSYTSSSLPKSTTCESGTMLISLSLSLSL